MMQGRGGKERSGRVERRAVGDKAWGGGVRWGGGRRKVVGPPRGSTGGGAPAVTAAAARHVTARVGGPAAPFPVGLPSWPGATGTEGTAPSHPTHGGTAAVGRERGEGCRRPRGHRQRAAAAAAAGNPPSSGDANAGGLWPRWLASRCATERWRETRRRRAVEAGLAARGRGGVERRTAAPSLVDDRCFDANARYSRKILSSSITDALGAVAVRVWRARVT